MTTSARLVSRTLVAGLLGLLAGASSAQLTAMPDVAGGLPPEEFVVESELYPADLAASDGLGSSSAVQGNVVVIGAASSDEVAVNAGAAYVYRRGARGWVLDDKLAPVDLGAGDTFGYSCSLDGDVLAIAAPQHAELGTQVGAVYIYRDIGGTFTFEQKIQPTTPLPFGRFGTDVSVSGDVVAVGRYRVVAGNLGTVHLYRFDGSVWAEEDTVSAPDGETGDLYAWSLDVDGDDLAVGAYLDDDVGSIYFYRHSGGVWTPIQKAFAPDPEVLSYFSKGLSLDDGVLVAGANRHDAKGLDAGAAYVMRFDGAAWVHEQRLLASNGRTLDRFGTHVAVSHGVIVVGARLDDNLAGIDAGSAYLFRPVGGVWTERGQLMGSDTVAGDEFGHTVATDGRTVLVNAQFHGHGAATTSGATYAFHLGISGSWPSGPMQGLGTPPVSPPLHWR